MTEETKQTLIPTAYLLVLLAAFTALSQAPLKAPTRTITVPWTAPSPTASWKGCVPTMPSCYFYLYRASALRTSASSSVDCPQAGGPSYALLNGQAPAVASPYIDTRAPRASVCYYARTVQGGQVSGPSNVKMYKGK